MVINLTEGDRGALLAFLSRAKYRLGFDTRGKGFLGKRNLFTHLQKTPDPRMHVVDYNLEILRILGLEAKEKDVSIYFSKQDEEKIEKIFGQHGIKKEELLVLIHPTSRWLFKCWEDKKTAAIIDYFQIKRKARVFLTAAPVRKELEKVEKILQCTESEPVNLSGKLTLKELAALAKRCDLFFGIDSAPMHIAAAVKTPVIALFGPSGEFNWGPWGEGHIVITKERDCRPCGRDGCDGTKRSLCLEEIEIDDVIEKINSRLEAIHENRLDKKEI
jgi:heptosyltransferase-3